MTSVTSVFRLLPIILLGLFPFLVQASAAERSAEVDGSSLAIDDPCARQVTITTDPSLHGRVSVAATADHPEEIDRLSFDTQGAARVRPLRDRASCWTPTPDGSFTPTLRLVLRVPEKFGVSIDEPGFGQYDVGAIGTLTLDLSGAGAVRVAGVAGHASVDLSGAAEITIAQADIDALDTELSGAGNVTVSQGRIGRVQAQVSGAGTVRVGATVGDASVELSGFGSVRFATLTGRLTREVSGAGTVYVGGVAVGGASSD